ncbi:hypothetical protein CUR178_06340 [Leishmania enriettii]|uniref:MYND-type domain-containing protein n=1 Tax=Leishmania enriettii TaxID=5663 RepID=A0A836GUA0_LEIEN|nr:hypothetical protein CUR178_06340 [Leishmania enriettii]
MNPSRMEEQLLHAEISDLGLTALGALVREQCLHNARIDARLSRLEVRAALPPQAELETTQKQLTCSSCDGGEPKNTVLSPEEVDVSAHSSPADHRASPMCDYCFLFSSNCFSCPGCGREWYCSAACQRLRRRYHAPRCRQQHLPQTRFQTRAAH